MLSRLHALVVPLFIAVMSLAYWVQLEGARRSAVVVPNGVLVLIGIFIVIVVIQEIRSPPRAPRFETADVLVPLGIVALSIAYYFAFVNLGFHVSNVLFVFVTSLMTGIRPIKAVTLAVSAGLVLFAMAWLMNFNTPDPIWAR